MPQQPPREPKVTPEKPTVGRPLHHDDKEQPDERPVEKPVRRDEQQPETD
jgi:hypothetical protein